MRFNRHSSNPVLLPDPHLNWECYNVFNPSVVHANGLFHMHYRAQGLDWVSRIGYAVSDDGVHWNRLSKPVFAPESAEDARGIEDPRVTELEGSFYMAYTAYGMRFEGQGQATHLGGGVLPMLAKSQNLITWEKIGPIVRGEDNKDHLLFPKRINGKYVALHRRPPQVWIAYSDDLVHWPQQEMKPVFAPRAENDWDSFRVGSGGVPLETEEGWLMIYHAYDPDHVYRLGACLLDLEDPSKVIHRPKPFLMEPQELWELRGDVPNVVFASANLRVGNEVYLYYGAADHVIGLATMDYAELLDFARKG
ncbi:MAG: glycosidase [Anaerolineaceae bacterium]|nr:glycosidase [Anaerolineaceae bacterium]